MDCIPADRIEKLLDGAQDDDAQRHLESCASCRSRLAQRRVQRTPSTAIDPGPKAAPSESRTGQETRVDRMSGPQKAVPPADDPVERGGIIGRYVVLDRVGFGGMGIVYSAYDPELDRRVAVKLLRSREHGSVSAAEAQSRLLREAQAMARVSHPNVVAVYDVGTFGDRVFMTMEYVEGPTLGDWLREKQRGWQEILKAFLDAGRGLAAAHAAGLVHRDFKPQNVLVSRSGRICVTDFGLVRPSHSPLDDENHGASAPSAAAAVSGSAPATQPNPPEVSSNSGRRRRRNAERRESMSLALTSPLTQVGVVMGTPGYMSPEQARAQPTDSRTDQFSFCVALYEALYRERPYPPGTFDPGIAESPKIPDPPRDSKVPAWVRRILLRGLHPDPVGRYPSMEALLEDLGRDPLAARRRRVAWVSAAVVLLGAGYVAARAIHSQAARCKGADRRLVNVWDPSIRQMVRGAFLAGGVPGADKTFEAVAQTLDAYASSWVAASTEACEATRIHGEQTEEALSLRMSCLDQRREELQALADVFRGGDPIVVRNAFDAVTKLQPVKVCADLEVLRATVRPPTDSVLQGQVQGIRIELARVKSLLDSGKFKEGLALAGEAAEQARAVPYRPLQGEALLLQGQLLGRLDRPAEAAPILREAYRDSLAGRDASTATKAASRLSYEMGYRLKKMDESREWFDTGRALVEGLQGGVPVVEAELLESYAHVLQSRDRAEEAFPLIQRAVALRERVASGPDDLALAASRAHLAFALYLRGDYAQAVPLMNRVLTMKEKYLGPEHPLLASYLFQYGEMLEALDRPKEALVYLLRAAKIEAVTYGPDSTNSSKTNMLLATVYTDLNQLDEALRYARLSLNAAIKNLGPDHPDTGEAIDTVADVLFKMTRYPEALAMYEKALALKQAASMPMGPRLAGSWLGIGKSNARLGHFKEAFAALKKAMEGRVMEGDEVEIAEVEFETAQAMRLAHREPKEASRYAMHAREVYGRHHLAPRVAEIEKFLAVADTTR